MRLLIITQKVDTSDPILGFFHSWIVSLASHFEKVSVICLEKGEMNLSANVKVYSLGKEAGKSKVKYVSRFFRYILGLAREYDVVFVHMNQEYVLMGGWFWRLTRKTVVLWRNHVRGSVLTRIAVYFATTILCTSKFAFVARYKKTKIMPAGVDAALFQSRKNNTELSRQKKILSIGRISPIKNIDTMIAAFRILHEKGIASVFTIVGSPVNPEDFDYYEQLLKNTKDLIEKNTVRFLPAVPHSKTPELYNQHEIFLNITPTGSLDKTIFEAAMSGTIPIVTNLSLTGEIDSRLIVMKTDPQLIAQSIERVLCLEEDEKEALRRKLALYVEEKQSDISLITKLVSVLQNV